MKAFSVTNIKTLMAGLLNGNLFTGWQLRSCELGLSSHISIEGAVNSAYYTDEELTAHACPFLLWEEIQPKIRFLIVGGHAPSTMNLTLAADPSLLEPFAEKGLSSLQLNLRYERTQNEEGRSIQRLTITTAASMASFSLDRSAEKAWDEAAREYLTGHGIELTEEA